MCKWILVTKQKPAPGDRFIGVGSKLNPRTNAFEEEWGLFTAPAHDLKDENKKVVWTKEEHLEKMLNVYKIVKWMIPVI